MRTTVRLALAAAAVLLLAGRAQAVDEVLSVLMDDGGGSGRGTAASGGRFNYRDALNKSLLFYEAQRSGKLPPDHRVPWRGDAMLDDAAEGRDLSGGYFDAGDHTKITFPLAFSLAQLAWGMLEFRSGYERAGQLAAAERTLQWGLDWLRQAHVNGEDELVVMVGDVEQEHESWTRPEDSTIKRPAFLVSKKRPGADVWAATAAAFAAGAVVFKDDAKYADELIERAEALYGYATDKKYADSVYSDTLKGREAEVYKSTRAADDAVWAGLWLYEATGEERYLQEAEKGYFKAQNNRWVFVDVDSGNACRQKDACYWSSVRTWNWDNAYPGAMVMMAAVRKGNSSVWRDAEQWLDAWADGDKVIATTKKGLRCLGCSNCTFGANRDAANAAFLALVASKYTDSGTQRSKWRCFAQGQINYMLGGAGRSLVVGFGDNPPDRVHHRAASCPPRPATCDWAAFSAPGPNPQVLEGALVSGQCSDDFVDNREDYRTNEVAVDKNAGFSGSLAALVEPQYQCRSS